MEQREYGLFLQSNLNHSKMKKTKRIKALIIAVLAAMTFITITSCTKDNDSSDNGNNDNTGIEFRMRNDANGGNYIYFCDDYCYLCMSSSNNFCVRIGGHCEIDIASVGSVSNLSKIKNIPESGWVDEIAVHPGYGYVIRYKKIDDNTSYKYARIYVEKWTESTSGGIIGAVIWYEDNWK